MSARFVRGDFLDDRFLVLDVRHGGMSDVYLTIDLSPVEMVCRAIKGLKFAAQWNEARQDALRHEAAAWVNLGAHPNVVQCFMVLEMRGVPHLLLDWVSDDAGETMTARDALRRQLLSPADALQIVADVCEALGHCDRRLGGAAHGDIKPENVLLGAGRQAKLTDFGLARTRYTQERSRGRDDAHGTPGYMAPELWVGGAASSAADVYAVGCMLYELFETRLPLPGNTVSALRRAHETDVPVPPRRLPGRLWALAAACLEKDPAARPTIAELSAGLAAAGARTTGAAAARPSEARESATVWGNRAATLANAGRDDEALEGFAIALALDPTLSRAYNNRALLYQRLGRVDMARRDWDEALRLDPDFVEVFVNLASSYRASGELDAALRCARRAVALGDRMPAALGNLAAVLLDRAELEEALATAERGLAYAPADLQMLAVRVEALMGLERWAEARRRVTELAARERDLPPLFRATLAIDEALCDAEMGEADRVLDSFEAWAAEEVRVAVLIGSHCLKRGRPAIAVRYLAEAVRRGVGEANGLLRDAMAALAEPVARTRRDPLVRRMSFVGAWEPHQAVLREIVRASPRPLDYARFVELLLDIQDPAVLPRDRDPLLSDGDFVRWLSAALLLLPGSEARLASFQMLLRLRSGERTT